jgi:hypothetical protein
MYTLTFYQAQPSNQDLCNTTDTWAVSLGSETHDGTPISDLTQGSTPWTLQTLMFTATSTGELLSFLAVSTPAGLALLSIPALRRLRQRRS